MRRALCPATAPARGSSSSSASGPASRAPVSPCWVWLARCPVLHYDVAVWSECACVRPLLNASRLLPACATHAPPPPPRCPIDAGFWEHEWSRHGTCAQPVTGNRTAFFQTVLRLHEQYDLDVRGRLHAAGPASAACTAGLACGRPAFVRMIAHGRQGPGLGCRISQRGP
jgi:hypothetical protein